MQVGEQAVLLHRGELVFVQVVGDRTLLTEEEPVVTLLAGDLALFQKGAKGGDAGAGADHDHGSGRIFGQAEHVVLVQEDGHGAADRGALAEVAGGDTLTVHAMRVVEHDADGGVHLARVRGLRTGDGVHARREAREDVEERLRVGDKARELLGEVDKLAAPDVLLGEGLVLLADERLERVRDVLATELRELVDRATRQLANGETRGQRFVERNFDLVVIEDALVAGEAEHFENVLDLLFAVGRDDADSVARRVGHALFEVELDVDGLFFGLRAGEAVVGEDLRGVGGVAGVFCGSSRHCFYCK